MHTDNASGARCFQTMVPMRDGIRLNTFVFLPASGGPRYPVILHRTPYGITSPGAQSVTDCTRAWLPSAAEPWTDQMVGMSGSSAGATTTFAAASQRHPSLRAFFIQVGASSIYDDVVREGQSIEMERLWLWVAKNIPGLSPAHREAVRQRFGLTVAQLDAAAAAAAERYTRLEAARRAPLPFIASADWM